MNFMKIICVNCGAKNYTKVDHRSYRRNFWSCEKKARKKIRLVRDSNPRPLRYRCSAVTSWAHKPAGSRSLNWLRPYRWKRGRIVDRAHSLAFSSVPLRESRSVLPFNWCCNDFGGLFPLPRLHTMHHRNHLVVFWTSILLLPCTLLEKCPRLMQRGRSFSFWNRAFVIGALWLVNTFVWLPGKKKNRASQLWPHNPALCVSSFDKWLHCSVKVNQ